MKARADRYPPGEPVRVVAPVPGDTQRGQVGTVERTYADAGDMLHRVRFADGQVADYYVDELRSTRMEPNWGYSYVRTPTELTPEGMNRPARDPHDPCEGGMGPPPRPEPTEPTPAEQDS